MKKKKTEVRQEQIAMAVLDIIASTGIESLSMTAVAEKVDLVPSAIYRHFSGKEEMIRAALKTMMKVIMTQLKPYLKDKTDPFKPFEIMIQFQRSAMPMMIIFPRIAFTLPSEGSYDLRRNTMREILDEVFGKFAKVVSDGQKNGYIKPELDPMQVVLRFWGILMVSTIRWHLSSGEFDIVPFQNYAYEEFKKSIQTESGKVEKSV